MLKNAASGDAHLKHQFLRPEMFFTLYLYTEVKYITASQNIEVLNIIIQSTSIHGPIDK